MRYTQKNLVNYFNANYSNTRKYQNFSLKRFGQGNYKSH